MPSVEEILIFAGVEVDSGVDVNETCVDIAGAGVLDGTREFVAAIAGTTVVTAPWQAANMKMESERIVFFIYLSLRHCEALLLLARSNLQFCGRLLRRDRQVPFSQHLRRT